MPLITHPLVRPHPVTGRKALYAVSGSSYGIVGMPDDEAVALLDELAAHATQPKYVLRFSYGVGDLVIWDNASLLHSATLIDPEHARTLWRITVKEPAPAGHADAVLAPTFVGQRSGTVSTSPEDDDRRAHPVSAALQASGDGNVDLQRDVRARRAAPGGQSRTGLSRLRDRSRADRAGRRRDARGSQPVSALGGRAGAARGDRPQSRAAVRARLRSRARDHRDHRRDAGDLHVDPGARACRRRSDRVRAGLRQLRAGDPTCRRDAGCPAADASRTTGSTSGRSRARSRRARGSC